MQVHLAVAEGRETLVGRNPKSDKASPSEDPARVTFGDVPIPPHNPADPGNVTIGPTFPVNPVVVVDPVPLPPFEPCPLPPGSGGGVRHAFEMLSQLSITQITVIIPAIPAPAGPAPTVLPP